MKVVVAPDSFKGSLSATLAARALARGVRKAAPGVKVVEAPIADGGEGTVEAMVAATGGRFVEARVEDPLGRPVKARYGILPGGRTAVIEMAAASGLTLIAREERNPMLTTTFGTGQLILDAAARGAREIIVGIGGSATVDGGTGMARALGVRFLDAEGRELSGGGAILEKIRRIDTSGLPRRMKNVAFTVASDVTNPLAGPRGAAAVYGPQKGATEEMVAALDAGLRNLAACMRRDLSVDVENAGGAGTVGAGTIGAGAAGGLGAALMAFLGARMRSGVEIVIEAVDLAGKLRGAGLVITGEGRVDAQSAYGKAVSGVAGVAAKAKVPCVLVAGSIGAGAEAMLRRGVTAIFSIAEGPATEEELMANAETLLERAGAEVTRLFVAGKTGTAKKSQASGRRGARPGRKKQTRAGAKRVRGAKKARKR
jgi:glycerate kinase